MPFVTEPIVLTEQERQELQQMTQSRTLPAGDVMRSRLVPLLADGVGYQRIRMCWAPLLLRLRVGSVGSCNIVRWSREGVTSRPAAVRADAEVAGKSAGCD